MKKVLAGLLIILGLALLVAAVEFVPSGNINLHNYYAILNPKNITGNLTLFGDLNVSGSTNLGSLNANSSNYWDNLDVPTDLNNKLTLNCGNITGSNFDLCINPDTNISDTNCSVSGSCPNIVYGVESDLNVNSSNYWDSLNVPTDLNNKITLDCSNITGSNFDLCTNPDTNISDTNCSADGSCSLLTYDSETTNWDKDASDDITTANIANQNVNSSNYWDSYDTPAGWDTVESNDMLTDGSRPMTGYLNMSGNKVCLNAACDHYLWYNGTHTIIT